MPTIKISKKNYRRLDEYRTTTKGKVTFDSAIESLLVYQSYPYLNIPGITKQYGQAKRKIKECS